jgi:hypothetical protein
MQIAELSALVIFHGMHIEVMVSVALNDNVALNQKVHIAPWYLNLPLSFQSKFLTDQIQPNFHLIFCMRRFDGFSVCLKLNVSLRIYLLNNMIDDSIIFD